VIKIPQAAPIIENPIAIAIPTYAHEKGSVL
jgi:hypothetical protein